MTRIEKIQGLIEEYADCRDELSLVAVAKAIDALYHEETEIAENLEAYWLESASGAEK